MSDEVRLLDSSVVIRHFRKGGPTSERLESFAGLYLPSIALGEHYTGANRSARPEKNFAQIEAFIAGATVIAVDDETARHYGQISAQLPAGIGTWLGGMGRQDGPTKRVASWRTPYFFDQMWATHMEIRSAGPDRILNTPDDIVGR